MTPGKGKHTLAGSKSRHETANFDRKHRVQWRYPLSLSAATVPLAPITEFGPR
jgi:hypothetical protein